MLNILGQDRKFPLPGEAKFLMPNALVAKAKDAAELDKARSLLFRCRRLVAARIVEEIYNEDGTQNKWWMQYAKMTFMGVKMTSDGDVI